jgi:hypothetical protein
MKTSAVLSVTGGTVVFLLLRAAPACFFVQRFQKISWSFSQFGLMVFKTTAKEKSFL